MLFYTLIGPVSKLEIHDDKLALTGKGALNLFRRSKLNWSLKDICLFEVTPPQLFFWGRIEWTTFDGKKTSFRYSTETLMVKKIEKFLQKVIIENYQQKFDQQHIEKKHLRLVS